MKIYRQKQRTQAELPNAKGILTQGIVCIALGGLPIASIIINNQVKRKVSEQMPIFKKAPSNYRKSYKLMKTGEKLADVGRKLCIGFTIFWGVYILIIVVMFGLAATNSL